MSFPFDMATMLAAQRRHLADELRPLDPKARQEKVAAVCIETGGTLILPDSSGTWGPLYAELTLLGLFHSGNNVEEAIANWIKSATRCTPIPPARAA